MDQLSASMEETVLINDAYFKSLLADIEKANNSIELEVYIFNDDAIGNQIADALIAAAKRNIRVRVLVDGIGSTTWGGGMTTRMETAGIETRVYHPIPWKIWQWARAAHLPKSIVIRLIYLLTRLNRRNHRKTCIIDKNIVYVGSANISLHHLNKEAGGNDWRDTTIRLENVDTEALQTAFDRTWGIIPVQQKIRSAFKRTRIRQVFRLNYSWRQRRLHYNYLLRKIKFSKHRIWITNAYFVPDEFLLLKLISAAKRGVDVKIVLPSHSDIIFMPLISNTFYTTLLKGDIAIYEYLPSFLHAKSIIIDDWFLVGSSNLNYRSLRHDLEVDVNVQSNDAKKILESLFVGDLENSRKISLSDVHKQSVFKRLIGQILLVLRYWV